MQESFNKIELSVSIADTDKADHCFIIEKQMQMCPN